MKRIFLFIATNLAVLLVMSVVLSLLGVDRFLTANGLNPTVVPVLVAVVVGVVAALFVATTLGSWADATVTTVANVEAAVASAKNQQCIWRSELNRSDGVRRAAG